MQNFSLFWEHVFQKNTFLGNSCPKNTFFNNSHLLDIYSTWGQSFHSLWLPNGELPNEFWDSCVEALFSKKAAARKQTVLRKTCPECPVNTSYKDSLICFYIDLFEVTSGDEIVDVVIKNISAGGICKHEGLYDYLTCAFLKKLFVSLYRFYLAIRSTSMPLPARSSQKPPKTTRSRRRTIWEGIPNRTLMCKYLILYDKHGIGICFFQHGVHISGSLLGRASERGVYRKFCFGCNFGIQKKPKHLFISGSK